MCIVLDKSFLDGARSEQVKSLCKEYTVLFSETLLFELMTTSPKSQQRCFSKFPDTINPVVLIPNVGTLLRFEIENRAPCTPLISRAIEEDFQFNKNMREGTFVPEGDIKKSLDEWARQVHDDTQEFLERCEVVYQFFPELNEIKNKYLPQAIYDLRIKVATNQDFIREVYSTFLDEHAPSDAPQPETLEPNWAFFRWTQCQLMSALRMFGKHQGNIKLPAPTGVFIRAEHTMHDIYYTILATLSGALASFDREIIEDFSLCCPEGALIVKQ